MKRNVCKKLSNNEFFQSVIQGLSKIYFVHDCNICYFGEKGESLDFCESYFIILKENFSIDLSKLSFYLSPVKTAQIVILTNKGKEHDLLTDRICKHLKMRNMKKFTQLSDFYQKYKFQINFNSQPNMSNLKFVNKFSVSVLSF